MDWVWYAAMGCLKEDLSEDGWWEGKRAAEDFVVVDCELQVLFAFWWREKFGANLSRYMWSIG